MNKTKMDKKAKGKKVYESIDVLCQEMAKFAVNSRKSKLIEEIESDLLKSEKMKIESKNIIKNFINNSNNDNNSIGNNNKNYNNSGSSSISNSSYIINDSSFKEKSKSSSNNFSSKDYSEETPKNNLNFAKNEKDKFIKNKLTKVNINKNKTQKLNNFTKNRFIKNNESLIKNSATFRIKSFGEISNTRKNKNVSFSLDKKSSNKLNIYNDIIDKKKDIIDKKEIKRKKTVIKRDLDMPVSPIEEKDKEESEKHMPLAKKTVRDGGILKKSNMSTDFIATFFDSHNNMPKVIIKNGISIENKKNKNLKSKFNSFIMKDDKNKLEHYYDKKTKDNDKKEKTDNDDGNDNDNISFDSEKSFKTTYNKRKKKKKKVDKILNLNKTFVVHKKKNTPKNPELDLKNNNSLNVCDITEGLIKFIDSSSKTSEEDEEEDENEDEGKNSKSSSINQAILENSLSNCITSSENDSSLSYSFNNQNKPNNNLLLHYYKNSKMKLYKNFLDKQLKRQRLTQIKIDKKRKQKELKEIQSCYDSPKINSISLEIIESKGNYIPLFKRAIELENERKMKLLINQKKKDKCFIDNNSSISRKTKKQISDFFCAQMDWKNKIEKKKKDLKNQLNQKEIQNNSQVINYEMKINPKSELIVSTKRKNDFIYNEINSINKSNSIINNSIRLYNDYQVRQKNLKKLSMELTPSFQPMIKKMPLLFYSGNISNNNKKYNYNKIDETKEDSSYNCLLYKNKSPITIKPQKSRNKNKKKNSNKDSEVAQNNQKEKNLKSTAIDSKNTKSVQKYALDISNNKQNIEQNSLKKIICKDREYKNKLNKSNYSQEDKNITNDNNAQNNENSKISRNSKNKKIINDKDNKSNNDNNRDNNTNNKDNNTNNKDNNTNNKDNNSNKKDNKSNNNKDNNSNNKDNNSNNKDNNSNNNHNYNDDNNHNYHNNNNNHNKINSSCNMKNLSNQKTTPKNSYNNINKINNKSRKNNINKIFQAIKQSQHVENSKKKKSAKLLSTNDKRPPKKSYKINTSKNQFKGPIYRFSVKNKKSSELFLDKQFNDINNSNKTLKEEKENDSINEFFNCEDIKEVKKNTIEKKILNNFKFNSSDDDEEEEEQEKEQEKEEKEDLESINENKKIKNISWKYKLKEMSKMKNNNKNIDSETYPQTIREIKNKKNLNLNGDKLYMLNVRNSSSTGSLKPFIISENTELFYKFFVKNQNIC